MKRNEANRIAKDIFVSYGLQADVDWSETCGYYNLDEEEEELVRDYFLRCADRVQRWLNT